jgi:agmatinase
MVPVDFDPNGPASIHHNIFGLPFSEEESALVLLPVPWEVTVSYRAGAARAPEQIFNASQQIDLYDLDNPLGWQKGFFMRPIDKDILMRSDYLRKEAELFIHFQHEGGKLQDNEFMQNSLYEVNHGGEELNRWVYGQTRELLKKNKRVGLIGGDHSSPLGYYQALGETYPDFGLLHIDAHLDLRKNYEEFTYSHASIMYNALEQVPAISKLVSVGIRDCCEEELTRAAQYAQRVQVFFDQDLKEKQYEGASWQSLCEEIISTLPEKVYISLDIDGLDPKLCPHTGTPVPGGMESGQFCYLVKKMIESGRELIGFDVVEVASSPDDYDANVGARMIFKLCNLMVGQDAEAARPRHIPAPGLENR